jgi:hypothetical protein
LPEVVRGDLTGVRESNTCGVRPHLGQDLVHGRGHDRTVPLSTPRRKPRLTTAGTPGAIARGGRCRRGGRPEARARRPWSASGTGARAGRGTSGIVRRKCASEKLSPREVRRGRIQEAAHDSVPSRWSAIALPRPRAKWEYARAWSSSPRTQREASESAEGDRGSASGRRSAGP